jgi:Kef-type K+ transport system membrane component KefB
MALALPLLGALFFVYLLALAFGEASRRIGIPALVGEIVAGIVIANLAVGSFDLESWVGLSAASSQGVVGRDALSGLADIGVVFLAFAVGLEVLPSAVRRFTRPAAITAAWGTTIPFVLGFVLVLLLLGSGSWPAALFVAVALTVTSLTVTARFLRDHALLDSQEAHLILGASLIEDVVGAVLLTVVLGVTATTDHGPIDLLYQIFVVLAGAVLFALFFFRIAPALLRKYARADPERAATPAGRQVAFVLAILLCLGASALANSFQLASIVGALLAGMALAEVRDRYDLRPRFAALNTFLVPFFFASIGLLVSAGELLAVWPLAVAVTVLAVAGKLVSVPFEAQHLGARTALRIGAGLVPRGEVAIVVALTAFDVGLISGDLYTALVVMAIATSVIGPILLHRAFRGAPTVTSPEPEPTGL